MTDILAGLDATTRRTDVFHDRIERAAAEGRGDDLVRAGLSLDEGDALRGHIVGALALTPVPGNARAAATLSSNPRRLASLLAFAQPPDLLAGLDAPELNACLAHELVLRDKEVPVAVPAGHPLAALPLHRRDVERRIELPAYHLRGSSGSLPFGPYPPGDRPGDEGPPAAVTRIADRPGMTAAVRNWRRDSNGVVEAAVFATPAVSISAALLRGLPMAAFEGAGEIALRPAEAAEVFAVLFAAASGGSAYGHGEYGAYGRLYAWESMRALGGSAWAVFSAGTAWYQQVAWDLGVAALGDGELAVLTATDTD